jgi:hypothetical protein
MSAAQSNKWFLQVKGTVQGPFNNDSLQKALQSMGEDSLSQALVWKRGNSEWIRAHKWQPADMAQSSHSSNENFSTDEHTHAAVDSDMFEKTFTQAFTEGAFYRVQIKFVDQPLMNKTELLNLISKQEDVSDISIQDPKTKEWKEVYAFPDIVEKLGISRRKQQRVPILAQFNGRSNNSKNVSYRVITVSEGGMGFTENYDLKIGDEVEGQITSPHFFQPISVKADVIYAGADGYIGLKFSQITDETKAAVIEYIKKFGKQTPK